MIHLNQMKFFSLGFSVILAFLIFVAVMTLHMAYFPAPEGPKRPEFPDSQSTPFSMGQSFSGEARAVPFLPNSTEPVTLPLPAQPSVTFPSTSSAAPAIGTNVQQMFPDDYQSDYEKYQEEMDKYEEDSKEFMKEEMVPYIKNMIIRYLILLGVLGLISMIFVRFISVTVGGAYALGGLFGVLFGMIGGIFVIPYTVLSSMMASSDDASEIIDMTNFLSGIGWTAVAVVVVLTIATILLVDGMLKFNRRPSATNVNLPPEAR